MAKKEKKQEMPLTSNSDSVYGLQSEQTKAIVAALDDNDINNVNEFIQDLHNADIADLIESISEDHRKKLLEIIKEDFDPKILAELNPESTKEAVEILGTEISARAISNLEVDDAVEVLEDLDQNEIDGILDKVSEEEKIELEKGLSYPEDSAGRLLEKNIISVPEYWNIGQVIDFLRNNSNLPNEFYQVFVIDPKFKPIGAISLSKNLNSKRDVKVSDVLNTDIKLIKPEMDQEEVAFVFRQYSLLSAPVVDIDDRIVGVITIDDIVNVIDEEASEDILHLGGVSETDFHSSFFDTTKRRFPWLIVNLITAILASVVISLFEGTIQKIVALAVLMPIVASMGGNAGTQTLTVAVRAIATKELSRANSYKVIGKELSVGFLNGLLFAILSGVVSYFWYGDMELSIIFALATIITLGFAGLSGVITPIALVRFGLDPAIASGVFVTTVTDIVAFGAFLGLAALLLL